MTYENNTIWIPDWSGIQIPTVLYPYQKKVKIYPNKVKDNKLILIETKFYYHIVFKIILAYFRKRLQLNSKFLYGI